ncbi:MAG: [protein-PII] uridylyltransferase [Lautropia sp.]|nr:[protein-PII] uridylyltransferase [Lautropia sp.]
MSSAASDPHSPSSREPGESVPSGPPTSTPGEQAARSTRCNDLNARVAELRTERQTLREQRIDAFRADQQIARLMKGLARDTDQLLHTLWQVAAMPEHWALFAVGGYGRGELHPFSDVDLLLLCLDDAPSPEAVARIECFIGACWDIGLEISHSVRTLAQCTEEAQADITTMTSLLERRQLAGNRRATRLLNAAMADKLQLPIFLRDKLLEMQQRHQKFEETPYSLEPNCKESPGALRDLQVITWISLAAGFGRGWVSLVRAGVIEPREANQLQRHERLLKRIRAWLHILAGRREDRLLFDLQPAVAKAMKCRAEGSRAQSEQLMQRYYLAAKAITQLSTILVQSLEIRLLRRHSGPARRLDAHFDLIDEQLDLRDPEAFEKDPRLILQAFRLLQLQPSRTGMTVRMLRALWNGRFKIDAAFRRAPENKACFLAILQTPRGITHALRLMNQWSVLGRYMPSFARIVGRMQHDLFHVYTVDQHILMVVRNLRRFMMAEHAHEYPFCSQLISNFEKPWLLIVAALFHDIAKGRGGDHSRLGEQEILRFCRHYGIEGEDRQLLAFLVREHLSMSMTAQKRDLADPEVIAEFAARVGSERFLTALYLLTVADIRGTSSRVWNAWKGKLLEDLYRATMAHLTGRQLQPLLAMDARRTEAARLLREQGLADEAYLSFWNELDIGYFLRYDPSDLAWHTRMLYDGLALKGTRVHARPSAIGEGIEILIFTADRMALFARICRFFDQQRLSILEARVHTTRNGMALDSFVVATPEPQTRAQPEQLEVLEKALIRLLEAPFEFGQLKPAGPSRLSARSRAFPLPPKIELRAGDTGQRYLLSVTATDRPGLLYDIARVLAQNDIDLHGARITTLGERAEDTFTIGSNELHTERDRLKLEQELLAVL